jgi:hypothetical protein
MQNEVVTQQVPVQVNRMEAVVEKRQVPYTVQRPVTRVVTRKVPVTKTEWVEQKMVRPYTVQKTSVKYEKVVREVPVQVYTTERVVNKVKVSKQTPRWVAHKESASSAATSGHGNSNVLVRSIQCSVVSRLHASGH